MCLRLERVGLPPKERAAAAAGRRLPPSAAPRVVFGGPAASLRARKENGREKKMGAKRKWARKQNGRENKMGAKTKWARKQNGRENKWAREQNGREEKRKDRRVNLLRPSVSDYLTTALLFFKNESKSLTYS